MATLSQESMVVWGKASDQRAADYTGPTSLLTPADVIAINAVTTEDLVKFEPGIAIRRRFIGDANGTLGLRGSSMFQTSRSMVFADGVPLHYFLQSRWNGAPRWTLVSASEIARAEVIYGPFSAAYSGNAMGGVVEIETAIPQQLEAHIDGTLFRQQVDQYGFDDELDGYKGFASVGNRVGDFSYYLSYNRLQNDAQPQSFRYATPSPSTTTDTGSGSLAGSDAYSRPVRYYGDTGIEEITTDNYKIKLGYDVGDWQALLNLAFEDRRIDRDQPNSYVSDLSGRPIWSGNVVEDGQSYNINASSLGVSYLERDSLSAGLRLRGPVSASTQLEINLNQFDILKDETRTSSRHPGDPIFDGSGQLQDYDNSGWQALEFKLTTEEAFGVAGLQWQNGARLEKYELNLNVYNSDDFRTGSRESYRSRFGGQTELLGAYTQFSAALSPQWQLSAGLRLEQFRSHNGYFDNDDPLTPAFELTHVPSASGTASSPKLSIAWLPDDAWQLRYSIARAYRFPIVEELFSQYQAYNTVAEANPGLAPEKGLHHNLMLEHGLSNGYVRVNLFHDTVNDAIEAQSTTLPGGTSLRTFIPIDETETRGVELILNQRGWLLPQLDLRFNLVWLQSEILRNAADTSLEGNQLPRLPEWRSNLLATYHLNPVWDISTSLQYASDSFGSASNTDNAEQVFGAIDGYTFVGVKSTLQLGEGWQLGLGVDNLTDTRAYVAHPWPGRTAYLSLSWTL